MRIITWSLFTLLILVLICGIVAGCLSLYLSNLLLDIKSDHTPTDHFQIIHATATTVTIPRSANTERQGVYGLNWDGGAAIMGSVLSSTKTTVTRQLLRATAPLAVGKPVTWNVTVYAGALRQSLGLPIQEVSYPDPLGPMPAWYVPGKLDTWALLVHGWNGSRADGLRVFPTLARLGLPILDISYRNDKGAPASPDRMSHLGDTEWQDLQAAAKYALAHGAHHLVLYGWSLGGAIVEAFEHRSPYARDVEALVLDSPVLNWRATLAYIGREHSFPPFLVRFVELISAWRAGIDFNRLDQLVQPQPATPLLLFHCVGDKLTPVAVSDAFAREHASIVTYHRIDDSGHIQAWNFDPARYEQELRTFLMQKALLHPSSSRPTRPSEALVRNQTEPSTRFPGSVSP
jgi:pimeloyl-ACP methyl ester carboxylesterase